MPSAYIPDRGDVVWCDFSPQSGHEQAGRRPALVLSSRNSNRARGLALICPITSRTKHHPMEIPITCKKISGSILADHMKSQDWRSRNVIFIDKASHDTVRAVQQIVVSLVLQ